MSDDKKVIYDAEENSIETVDASDPRPELDQLDMGKKIIYDAENPEPIDSLGSNHQEIDEKDLIDENQKNVFEDGLNGGQFIRNHNCPICMVGKKSISELYMKKRFRKKKVVGYASICANCGFTSFYTTNIDDLLALFRGKVTK